MNTLVSTAARPLWALILLAAASGAAPALAGRTTSAASKSEAQYQRDAAACLSPRYKGDPDECMSAASTARAGREPVVIDRDPGRYERNALKRCDPLPVAERADCVARMKGNGTVSGSVEGGGIYRELVTREPGVAPAEIPAIPAAADSVATPAPLPPAQPAALPAVQPAVAPSK